MEPMQQSSLHPLYQNTMFQNPMPNPSYYKSRKTLINSKGTCHTMFWHSALWLAYPKIYICQFSSLFKHFSLFKLMSFSFFCQGEFIKLSKISNLLILTGKMHQNGLSGAHIGFKVCQIQWHRFQVSTLSGFWEIKNSGKNFTFCWFWLGKMYQNGLSSAY